MSVKSATVNAKISDCGNEMKDFEPSTREAAGNDTEMNCQSVNSGLPAVRSTAWVDADENRHRMEQLELNARWLREQIDAIHEALCPDQNGTWQQRAQQAVTAAQKASNDLMSDGPK